MNFLHQIQPLYVLSGLVVGGLVGMTGVGGGSLMTPVLILLFGIHPATAVGTDLLLRRGHQDGRHAGPRLQPEQSTGAWWAALRSAACR